VAALPARTTSSTRRRIRIMKAKMLAVVLSALAAVVLATPDAWADVIHLKNGNSFRVRAWQDAGDAIEFTRHGGTVQIPKADVLRIESETGESEPEEDQSSRPTGPAVGLADALRTTPPAMTITYVDKTMLGLVGEMNPASTRGMTQLGVGADQVDSLVFAMDPLKMLSGQGGLFVAIRGTFTAAGAAERLRQDGYARTGEQRGFALYSKREGQGESLAAVRDNIVISGAPPDVRAGLMLQAGGGASAYESKGVQGALRRAGEARMAMVLLVPAGAQRSDTKDYAVDSMVVAIRDVAPDKTASATIVMACPTEEDARLALADMRRQAAAKPGGMTSVRTDGTYVVATARGRLGEISPLKQR
jgi:hypothetical protein